MLRQLVLLSLLASAALGAEQADASDADAWWREGIIYQVRPAADGGGQEAEGGGGAEARPFDCMRWRIRHCMRWRIRHCGCRSSHCQE